MSAFPALAASRRPRRVSRRRGGFTLLEILVASGLMAVLVGLVLAVTFTAVEAWNRATSTLTSVQQARASMDLLQQDLEAAVFRAEGADAWLVYEELPLDGQPKAAATGYLRFLSRPVDRDPAEVGVLNALAYQVIYANPLRASATSGRIPALYRGRLNTDEVLNQGGLDNLPTAAPSIYGLPSSTAYVAAGIARLTVRFGVTVRAANGERFPYVLQVGAPGPEQAGVKVRQVTAVSFPLEDFVADELGTPVRIVAPDWVEVSLTILPDEALRLLDAAASGLAVGPETEWDRVVERYGTTFSRRVVTLGRGW